MPSIPDYRRNEKVNLGFGLTDQVDDWRTIGYLDDYAPVQLECHVYEGPNGHGYILKARVRINGVIWRNQMHIGLENRGPSYVWVKEG